jgi:carbon monoxide dehydrogenase subunit G
MLHKILKAAAPIATIAVATAMAGATTGCKADINIGGSEGVPLADLDMSGDAPTSVLLAGPDKVVIKNGKSLKIAVDGDEDVAERLRFTNDDGTLGIMRENGSWTDGGDVTVNVTMPAPRSLTVAGSGSIEAASLEGNAEANLLGSGSLNVKTIKAEKLDLTIAASGSVSGAGTADTMELNIMGSGGADLAELSAEEAEVAVMGSGSAAFASDGKVKADIMGSGSVRVIGRAECEVSSMGSGSLKCEAAPAKKAAAKKTAAKKKATKKRKS